MYGVLNNIIVMSSPILVIPFVISHIGVDNYGGFVQVNIIYACLVSIFSSSLSGYFIKRYTEGDLSLKSILLVQASLSFVSALVLLIYICVISNELNSIFFVFAILTNILNFEWYFYAVGAQKQLCIRNFFVKIVFVIATILFLRSHPSVDTYFIAYGLNLICTNLLTAWFCFKSKKNIVVHDGKSEIHQILFDARYFFLNPIIGAVYQYGDQILISFLFQKSSLVFVNLAKQIIGASVMISGTLCRVEQKNIFSLPPNKKIFRIKKIAQYFAVYLILSTVAIIFCGPYILSFLIKDAALLHRWYYILIAGVFLFTSLSIFIDYVIGLTYRKEYFTTIANASCAVIVTLLNVNYLNEYGANFSLFTLLIGEILVFILLSVMHINSMKKRAGYG